MSDVVTHLPTADYSQSAVVFSGPMRLRSSLSIVACLAAGLSGPSCGQTPPAWGRATPNAAIASARVLAVGDMAPEFSLAGSDGKQYSLASYRGRQSVVLAWFSKAFTEG